MEKWEYKSLAVNWPDLEKEVNALGEQGWEAVGFAPWQFKFGEFQESRGKEFITEWHATGYRVLFKRRKP